MKKVFLFIVLVALFTTTTTNATAQNRYALENDKGSRTVITSSDRTVTCHQDEPLISFTSSPEVMPKAKGTAPTHTLNVYPPTGWTDIYVFDNLNTQEAFLSYTMGSEFLSVELEEGIYNIVVVANRRVFLPDDYYWQMDGVELYDNTDVYADFDECVYDFTVDFVDENGDSFDNMEFCSMYYSAYFVPKYEEANLRVFRFDFDCNSYIDHLPLHCNGFDEQSYFFLDFQVETGNNKSYLIKSPSVFGIHESQHFTSKADDLSVIQETFSLKNDPDNCWYYLDKMHVFYMSCHGSSWDFFFFNKYDPSQPYTIVSNARNYDGLGVKTILYPVVYDGYDIWEMDDPVYTGAVRTPLYLDANGNVVREARPWIKELQMGRYPALYLPSYPNLFPETPAMKVITSDKMTYFGERTPLSIYHPEAFKASNTPYNLTYFRGDFYFIGEQSSERMCDQDSYIRVWIGDQQVYNNSVLWFNYNGNYFQFEPNEPTDVVIETTNDHVFANEVPKTNITRVEFDLGRDDAMPPTMTFLRVLDGNGDETIWHDRLPLSTLVFGCADFDYHWTVQPYGSFYDQQLYNGKPEVEVLYSLDGETWEPLVFAEDESLFHIDYGNVFVADLGQLEGRALNQWVSLKFTLTDAAGNTQSQTLENVFYAGEMVSVNEHTVESLQHQVYPNPFSSEVKITAAEGVNGVANIAVYNILGEQVYGKTENCMETKEFTIDGSAWKTGVYFYSINTESGLLQGKIVKK